MTGRKNCNIYKTYNDYYKSILNKKHLTDYEKELRIRNNIIISTRHTAPSIPIVIYDLKHFKDLIYKSETVPISMKLNMFNKRIVEYEDDTDISGCNVVKSIQIGKKRTECYYACSDVDDDYVYKDGMYKLYRIKPTLKYIYKKNNKIVASVMNYDKTHTYKNPTYIHNSEITDGYSIDYSINDGCFCVLHI